MGGFGVWLDASTATDTVTQPAGITSVELTDAAAPQTVYVNGPHGVYDPVTDRTFIAYLGFERDLYVTYYDHQTGQTATPVEVGVYPIADDDNHGAPAVAIDLDGYLHVVWGSHNTTHRHSKSTTPRSIAAWTTQTLTTAGTYPHLAVHPASGHIYIVDRAGTTHGSAFPAHEFASLRVSTDGGSTFSAAAAIIDTTGAPETHCDVYLMGAGFGDDGLLHLSWLTARGSSHDDTRRDIYHAAYDPDTATMKAADGTDLGATVDWADHTTCLAATENPVLGLTQTLHGDHIIIPFGRDNGTSTTTMLAVWDGTAWTEHDTGITQPETTGLQVVWIGPGGVLRGVFTTQNGTYGDLVVYGSDNYADWYQIATLASGSSGEGYTRVEVIAGGPGVAITQQEPTAHAATSATLADLLPLSLIVDPTLASGTEHTHDYAPVGHTHGAASSAETVFAPAYTVTDAAALDLAVTFVWGVDATGDPYYNAAGVTAGEEAVLVLDNASGSFSLRPVEV